MCVRWWLKGGGDGEGSVVKDEIERARSSERNSLEEGIRQRKDRGAKEKRRQNELSKEVEKRRVRHEDGKNRMESYQLEIGKTRSCTE